MRRGKAPFPSGCEPRPATVAPAGSQSCAGAGAGSSGGGLRGALPLPPVADGELCRARARRSELQGGELRVRRPHRGTWALRSALVGESWESGGNPAVDTVGNAVVIMRRPMRAGVRISGPGASSGDEMSALSTCARELSAKRQAPSAKRQAPSAKRQAPSVPSVRSPSGHLSFRRPSGAAFLPTRLAAPLPGFRRSGRLRAPGACSRLFPPAAAARPFACRAFSALPGTACMPRAIEAPGSGDVVTRAAAAGAFRWRPAPSSQLPR